MTPWPAPRWPSVQRTHVEIESIEDGMVRLAGGHYRAVLEVGGVNFGTLGEDAQAATLAGYAAFLNGLDYPIQILVRVLPVDIEQDAVQLEQRASRDLDGPLAELALDHALFLRRLTRDRLLLERRFYVVVPAQTTEPTREPLWPPRTLLSALFRRGPSGRRGRIPAPAAQAAAQAIARRQLSARCDEVARQMARCALPVRRLAGAELVELFYGCWNATLARRQPLQPAIDDSLTLAVRTSRTVRGAAGTPPAEGRMPCPC